MLHSPSAASVALYMHYWGAFGGVPQWGLCARCTYHRWHHEYDRCEMVCGDGSSGFALIKVLAIVTFLVVGTVFLGSGQPLDGNTTGFHLITDNGGFFPHGLLPALVLIQGRSVCFCLH